MAIKKDELIKAVEASQKIILIASGYNTNVGLKVFVERTSKFQISELPAINIFEVNDSFVSEESYGAGQVHTRELALALEVIGEDDIPGSLLRKIEADINKAIGVDETFGGLAVQTHPGSSTPNYVDQNERKLAGKTIEINIQYRVAAWQSE